MRPRNVLVTVDIHFCFSLFVFLVCKAGGLNCTIPIGVGARVGIRVIAGGHVLRSSHGRSGTPLGPGAPHCSLLITAHSVLKDLVCAAFEGIFKISLSCR